MGYNPNYKWINPTYSIYNWGYNPLTKWDEPPSSPYQTFSRISDLSLAPQDPVVEHHLPHKNGHMLSYVPVFSAIAISENSPSGNLLNSYGKRPFIR